MFEKIKKALGLGNGSPRPSGQTEAQASGLAGSSFGASSRAAPQSKVSEWASMQGLSYTERSDGRGGYDLQGKVGGKPWRLEQGKPSRDFIVGLELRARAELDVREDVAVMIMSRKLKNDLDKRAFALYTDSLQTIADPRLPEEMRWLAMYEEVGWESLGNAVLDNYAILADKREDALAWVSPDLAKALMDWPLPNPNTPMILMLLRGKAYMRMQITEGDMPTLEHAAVVFTIACELAMAALSTDVAI